MKYISTRGEKGLTGSEAILNGIANDGGLYVPEHFPIIDLKFIKELRELNYAERASKIFSLFLDDYNPIDLDGYTEKAYSRFTDEDPAPLVKIDDLTFILELWHGPTLAFKDMALTVLPYLLVGAREKKNITNKTLILVATSGDTGKAALSGFSDVEGTEIVVLYPSEGVSEMQKLQMQTAEGQNVHVLAIEGNFDDAQKAVKEIFNDKQIAEELDIMGYTLSSANSINWGRLLPQIAYYISSYTDLLDSEEIEEGEEINFVVPSGNFGNILAGYYAKRMGLPIKDLIVASNKNNILTDFFNLGEYDTNREFYKTMSPSMDILVSSNLERLLFELGDRNPDFVKSIINDLSKYGSYRVDLDLLIEKIPEFKGFYSSEEETLDSIDNFFDMYDYLLDPHTAVGVSCFYKYLSTDSSETKTVIISTANPYKFPEDVLKGINVKEGVNIFKSIEKLSSVSGMEIPEEISELADLEVIHDRSIKKEDIKKTILSLLK